MSEMALISGGTNPALMLLVGVAMTVLLIGMVLRRLRPAGQGGDGRGGRFRAAGLALAGVGVAAMVTGVLLATKMIGIDT